MSEASVKIESQDLSIESLYKDFYTVPDFQREYVWQREQLEKLLQAVHDEFYDEDGQLINGPEARSVWSIPHLEASEKGED